jgi:hypothetical protein
MLGNMDPCAQETTCTSSTPTTISRNTAGVQ